MQHDLANLVRVPLSSPEVSGGLHDDHLWLWEAYSFAGGLVTVRELLDELMAAGLPQRVGHLGACFRKGLLVKFAAEGDIWIPRFQFTRSYTVREGVTRAIAVLQHSFPEHQIALWFCTSNIWLHDAAPMDVVELKSEQVVWAARWDAMGAAEH